MKKVLLLANGPGELWCWVRPMVKALKTRGYEVTIGLLPCQFSSGEEVRLASSLGADRFFGPYFFLKSAFKMLNEDSDLVLQLGGDLLYGLMASRGKKPFFCYTYGPKPLMEKTDLVMTAWESPLMPESVPVGDLTSDALAMDEGPSPWKEEGSFHLVFFPGSRPAIRRASFKFLSEVKDALGSLVDNVEITTALSPFASEGEVNEWEEASLAPSIAGTRVILERADLALTQPGTNTLELMHLGVPTVVAVPFRFLEHVPLGGLKGIFLETPFLGKMIKGKFLRRAADSRRDFLAWPNRIAKEMIMKEVVGDITPAELAQVLAELMLDKKERLRQKERLISLAEREKVAEKILFLIEKRIC